MIDDGPRSWDEAIAMCRAAAAEGIETIIATPHALRGRWRAVSSDEIRSRVEELQQRIGDVARILPGSEYFFGHDAVEVLQAGTAVLPLAGSRYVLIELAANNVPPLFEQPLYRMQLEGGWTPVIAHPERNLVFQAKPALLAFYIRQGAKTQITAGSLLGEFGPEAKAAAETFVRGQMVHFVATDAHNMTKRPPHARAAIDALRELAGEDVADALTRRNPLAVIEKRALAYDPEPVAAPSSGLLTRLRSFFGR